MEALLIINSILAAVCFYFLRDIHKDFKQLTQTVEDLKSAFTAFTIKVKTRLKSNSKRLGKIEQKEERA